MRVKDRIPGEKYYMLYLELDLMDCQCTYNRWYVANHFMLAELSL